MVNKFWDAAQDTRKWMINSEEFWKRWHSGKKVYMLTNKEAFGILSPLSNGTMYYMGSPNDDVLCTNMLE